MESLVAPYLDLEGVEAAALVSTDGFTVAAAGSGIDFDALGAHAAALLATARELAAEMEQQPPKALSIDLGRRGLVVAPIDNEVFLVLAGSALVLQHARGRR